MKSRHLRRFASLGLTVSVALVILSTSAKYASSQDTIRIGVVTARSGALSYYAEMEINGLYLGIEYATGGTFQVLGKTVEILVEDDFGNPTESASKATKLILQHNVDILQGCASSACASAVQAIAQEYGVVFMVAPAADAEITGSGFNKYTFRTASNTWQDALTGGPFAVAFLGKTFAFLAPDYSWGYSSVNTWSTAVENAGGEVLHIEYAPSTEVNFAPYLNRIIAADPDVLIPIWSGTGSLQLFPAMSDLGIYDLMNVTSGIGDLFSLQFLDVAMNFTGMTKYAYTLPNNTVNDWLVNTWKAKYDADTLPMKTSLTLPVPDLFVESAFSAGQAIVYAIEEAGSADAEDLIPVLEGLSFTSPKGPIQIRQEDHQALQSMYIAQVFNDTTSFVTEYPQYSDGFTNLRLIAEIPPEATAPPIENDDAPPAIGGITIQPSHPTPLDDVTVTASIIDERIGVKNASLYYSITGGDEWTKLLMNFEDNSKYEAIIPKQANEITVHYYIEATDGLNTGKSDTDYYVVRAEPSPATWWDTYWPHVTVGLIAAIAVVAGVLYFKKRRAP